jgi:agmatine deiminase
MPAEWEPQEAVFLTYTGDPNDAFTTAKVHAASNELIEQVAQSMKIYVLINDNWNKDSLLQLFNGWKYNIKNIELIPVPYLFTMGVVRDYGPIITKTKNGKRKLIQFDWDYVGANFINPDSAWVKKKNDRRDKYFNQMSKLLDIGVVTNKLAIEGGEIEVNGKGTALLVDSFTRKRNPFLNNKAIDSLLKVSLGVTNVIWLKEGVAEDPPPGKSRISGNVYGGGVGGHIDEFARFVNPNTILLSIPDSVEVLSDSIKRINYDRMKVNFDILSKAKDQDGNAFNIIKVPIPDVEPDTFIVDTSNLFHPVKGLFHEYPEIKHRDTIRFLPAVSYLNYVILNDLIILPKYWKAGSPESSKRKDEQVKLLFQHAFPGKKIIQLNPWGLNYVGGGFHCWTQQIPAE